MRKLFKIVFTAIYIVLFIPKMILSRNNIIYGDYQNQINLNLATSIRKDKINNSGLEKLYIFMFQYSQPDEFFRLQARKNFEILGTFRLDNYAQENNQFAIGLSEDIIIPLYYGFYMGAGLGYI